MVISCHFILSAHCGVTRGPGVGGDVCLYTLAGTLLLVRDGSDFASGRWYEDYRFGLLQGVVYLVHKTEQQQKIQRA